MSSRSNPFDMIERMFEQMSRQFEDAARSWESGQGGLGGLGVGTMGIDLADKGDEFVVTADVPGFEKDEIDLRVRDRTLSITAEHEQTGQEQEENYLRSEREHRRMSERVDLPEPVETDGVEATLKNGVLTVRLPKMEPGEAGGTRIDID